MKKLMALSVVASALMLPAFVNAATTADVKLIGTITPASCVPAFVGGNTIDYGHIASSSLNATAQTMLPEQTTKFSVTCDAPVKFAFSLVDERAATSVTTLNTISGYDATYKFGLGAADNGAKIGTYSLQISSETADSGATQRLFSVDGGATWATFGGGLRNNSIIGFAASSSATVPSPHKSIAVDVRVVAAIDKSANLPLTTDIKIDGLTTIEVKYL